MRLRHRKRLQRSYPPPPPYRDQKKCQALPGADHDRTPSLQQPMPWRHPPLSINRQHHTQMIHHHTLYVKHQNAAGSIRPHNPSVIPIDHTFASIYSSETRAITRLIRFYRKAYQFAGCYWEPYRSRFAMQSATAIAMARPYIVTKNPSRLLVTTVFSIPPAVVAPIPADNTPIHHTTATARAFRAP